MNPLHNPPRTSRGAAPAAMILLPLLSFAGGCFGPCGSTPVVLLPVILAAAPVVLAAQAIDDHSPGLSNADFILAGQLVDDQGRQVDSAEAEITAWIATHRHSSFTDRWDRRTERRTLGSQFRLNVKDAQALDIVLRQPGFLDQRVIFNYGVVRPPFIHIKFDTYRPWNNQVATPGPPIDSADLEGGGTFYEGYNDVRPVRKEDLRVVMQRRAPEAGGAAGNPPVVGDASGALAQFGLTPRGGAVDPSRPVTRSGR